MYFDKLTQFCICLTILGDTEKAREIYLATSLIKDKKKKHSETVAISQAKKYFENGGWFAPFELLYLRRDLAKMLFKLPELMKFFEEFVTTHCPKALEHIPDSDIPKLSFSSSFGSSSLSFLSPKLFGSPKKRDVDWSFDHRCSYLLIKGALTKSYGRPSETIPWFKEIIRLSESTNEKFFAPYAYVELAEVYVSRKEIKKAEEATKKAFKYSEYDWSAPLDIRMKIMLEQLKKMENPPLIPTKRSLSLEESLQAVNMKDD